MSSACVVAGGAGAVGGMLTGLLRDAGAAVTIADPAVSSDILAPSPELAAALAAADVVVLAVPGEVAVAALPVLAPLLRTDALLVETLSVKGPVSAAITAHRPDGPALGVNPMFAPDLAIAGRPIAVVSHRDGPGVAKFLEVFTGARLVPVTAAAHDRLTATAQALTHAAVLAFGSGLAELDVDIEALTALAPPPCATLLSLLARISSGEPEVYWEIQADNPDAAAARAALGRGAEELGRLVETGDRAGFDAGLAGARAALGTALRPAATACAAVFATMPALPATSTSTEMGHR
ncbi:prephenate dehydrogenase dimerization domain-containing protein [Amycolatopsis sp. CA-230715]|uniref:prephenate dehydrogenase dimerization domain-containing protein n=1 Tax=Amycolatopsis sp. CA-230715 TaxID=2745196 RepID=UPI001C0199FB|nr:prephenate dehydrogenase dimerization domain-containing protein [Amycolatopsis sp. CA-230715]QWF78802.1 T-protein [Amycolatopsis sp. CA-230715]